MKWKAYILVLFCLLGSISLWAQNGSIKGKVISKADKSALELVDIIVQSPDLRTTTNASGTFILSNLAPDTYEIIAFQQGLKADTVRVTVQPDRTVKVKIQLEPLSYALEAVDVKANNTVRQGLEFMDPVDTENLAIHNGQKTEMAVMSRTNANLATNNPRQAFNNIAGLNIWESDGAGLQIGIGGRGLSPDRTSNFNTRQDGVDMSADALGYPESYYSPPLEAVDRVEVLRGAASLQYGTQFGGMINFRMKSGPEDKKFEFTTRQSAGTFGLNDSIAPAISLYSSFNSIGGKVGRLRYYAFHQLKTGHGWRRNSGFDQQTMHTNLQYELSEKASFALHYTYMTYEAQQPGGLTDQLFERDARASFRDRNWFSVDWNLAALHFNYKFTEKTRLNIRSFGLIASRRALGHLGQINRTDPGTERDLIWGDWRNWGTEARVLHQYDIKELPSVFLAGVRYYQGYSQARQGLADANDGPNFLYLNPDNLEGSDYTFPNENAAAFLENLFYITPRFSITPGVRFEHIKTTSDGVFRRLVQDGAGNVIEDTTLGDAQSRIRSFVIGGIGLSYKTSDSLEIYGNFSQNYRSITFSDIQIRNTGLVIDPDIQDERGFNFDLGVRGRLGNKLSYDISAFYLQYRDRIGAFFTTVPDPVIISRAVRFRTNVSDARNLGIEGFVETDLFKVFQGDSALTSFSLFANVAYINARYVDSKEPAFDGKFVELVPEWNVKTGIKYQRGRVGGSLQLAHVTEQFSDATNAERTPNAVDGIIPAYQVVDLSMNYTYKFMRLEGSINNLTNEVYFTRRASGYPGPGILPSDGRSFFLTLQLKF